MKNNKIQLSKNIKKYRLYSMKIKSSLGNEADDRTWVHQGKLTTDNFDFRRVLMKKMSQSELSKRIGVSHQAISKWETGENYPDFMSLISLAQLFEVSLDILVYQ